MAYVIGFGGATVDLHLRCKSPALLHDSNPAKAASSPGGVMRNILENLQHLGQSCVLLSAVGKDSFGESLRQSCTACGMDGSHLYQSQTCSSALYFSFLDSDGDMLVAANAMDIMDEIPAAYLTEKSSLIQGAAAAVVDANPALERIEEFVALCQGKVPVFADPVSVAKGGKLKDVLPGLHLIKPNEYELQLLSGVDCSAKAAIERASEKILHAGCFSVAVSLGKEGCYYADQSGLRFFRSLPPDQHMVNATGAGDAFMAGLISGTMDGLGPEGMVLRGLACGKLAVGCAETINRNLSVAAVEALLKTELL